MLARPQPIREILILKVIKLKIVTGEGTDEDPVRHVTYWIDSETGETIHCDDHRIEAPIPGVRW